MLGGKLAGLSTVKVAAAVLGVLTLSIGGAWTVGVIGAPSVVGVENQFGAVNKSTTVIESDIVINNPNPLGVQLGGLAIDYAVEMNGVRMATGGREGVDIQGQGNSTISLTTMMQNEKLPAWWVTHVRNGENTTLVVDASVRSDLLDRSFEPRINESINTSIIAAFNSDEDRPIEANQPALSDPVLWLNSSSGSWGDVSNETTEIDMAFDLYNPKPAPVVITELGYDIRMNNVTMGEGKTNKSATIPPGATETVYATTLLENENLDDWWVTHLQNNQTTQLEVEFYARVDLSSVGGSTRIPLDTFTQTIETDMFGTDGESDGSAGENGAETGTATSTASSGTSTASGDTSTESGTDTPTESPTASPTPTPTETDDGILSLAWR
jgi:LEA14-like dessication related protein